MTVEERKQDARTITREILMNMMDDPGAIVMMTMDCTKPEDIEHQVAMILEYMDRTEPKKTEEAEDRG